MVVVFTKKLKVPIITPPSLTEKKLEAMDSAKNLEVILDRKLNWNEYLKEKIRKFHATFWLCRGTFGGGWELKPKMLVWLYKAVIVPKVAYASTIQKAGEIERPGTEGSGGHAYHGVPEDAVGSTSFAP